MKRTVVDIRPDGPHIVPDPNATLYCNYDPRFLSRLGADDAEVSELTYRAGLCAGLGAFFDALVLKGHQPDEAQSLLWTAYENLSAVRA